MKVWLNRKIGKMMSSCEDHELNGVRFMHKRSLLQLSHEPTYFMKTTLIIFTQSPK